MISKLKLLVVVLALLMVYPDEFVYSNKYEYKYRIERQQGHYRIDADEKLVVDSDRMHVTRKKIGLLATGVKDVKAGGTNLLLTTWDKKNTVYQIDLLEKTKDKKICYKKYKITDQAEGFYPISDTDMFYRNKKDEICYTGVNTCHMMFEHKSAETCKKAEDRHVRDRVVLKDVTKCWSSEDMFAYVKDNNLYITGWALTFDARDKQNSKKCYQRENVKCFFEGKGDQVKQVVCGQDRDYMIFVLLKDGSVWGIGDNSRRLITNTDTKTHMEFVKAESKGIKQVEVCENTVVFLKKDNTLWARGRGFRKKEKCSYQLRKIDSNVKEVCLPCRNKVLYVKKDSVAYGMGYSTALSFDFTDRYSKRYRGVWINKPMKLMKNVKHVYSGYYYKNAMFMTEDNDLYWVGNQGIAYLHWW